MMGFDIFNTSIGCGNFHMTSHVEIPVLWRSGEFSGPLGGHIVWIEGVDELGSDHDEQLDFVDFFGFTTERNAEVGKIS